MSVADSESWYRVAARAIFAISCLLALCSACFAQENAYDQYNIHGWTVLVSKDFAQDSGRLRVRDDSLALLRVKLLEVERIIPAKHVEMLRNVRIWLEWNSPDFPGGVYHPSRQWLVDQKKNPAKAKGIEFGNANNLLGWVKEQPMMVLHELAHAFHDQAFGYDNAEIEQIFKRTMASGSYSRVRRANGNFERAYAMNNAQEYFAESSEAYFGINDFYPTNRRELQAHDPLGYAMVERMWGPGAQSESLKPSTQDSCSQEAKLRSLAADTPAQLIVLNFGNSQIQLFWLDYAGRRQSFGSVIPGRTLSIDTYYTHPWVVTDAAGRCLEILRPAAKPARFVVGGR